MGRCGESDRAFHIKVKEGSENFPFLILVSLPSSTSFLGHIFEPEEERERSSWEKAGLNALCTSFIYSFIQ